MGSCEYNSTVLRAACNLQCPLIGVQLPTGFSPVILGTAFSWVVGDADSLKRKRYGRVDMHSMAAGEGVALPVLPSEVLRGVVGSGRKCYVAVARSPAPDGLLSPLDAYKRKRGSTKLVELVMRKNPKPNQYVSAPNFTNPMRSGAA